MDAFKGTLVLIAIAAATLLTGYLLTRLGRRHRQPLDTEQVRNLQLMTEDMRKNQRSKGSAADLKPGQGE